MIIIFDLWGTLGTKDASFSTSLKKHFNLSSTMREYEEALQLEPWDSLEEMAEHFLKSVNLELTKDNISFVVKAQQEAISTAAPYERMRGMLEHLREENHTIALLSNSTIFEAECLSSWGFKELFSATVYPFETGVIKPDKESYLAVCDRLGVSPENCLFIDDTQKNCEAAKKVGMRTHQFVDVTSFELFLREEKLIR